MTFRTRFGASPSVRWFWDKLASGLSPEEIHYHGISSAIVPQAIPVIVMCFWVLKGRCRVRNCPKTTSRSQECSHIALNSDKWSNHNFDGFGDRMWQTRSTNAQRWKRISQNPFRVRLSAWLMSDRKNCRLRSDSFQHRNFDFRLSQTEFERNSASMS